MTIFILKAEKCNWIERVLTYLQLKSNYTIKFDFLTLRIGMSKYGLQNMSLVNILSSLRTQLKGLLILLDFWNMI